MSIIFLLIPLSVLIATGFLLAFIWAVRSGQYEDTCTPSMRMLLQDPPNQAKPKTMPGAGSFPDDNSAGKTELIRSRDGRSSRAPSSGQSS
jgi:cbb3-type cytochrome oxidase maturation protein